MVEARVPGDKSMTHRALIFAALANGESRLSGLLDAADTRATAAALRALGAAIPDGPLDTLTIAGGGLQGFREPGDPLDCGNSGTTARLLLGALAGSDLEATLTGDASLRRRPMARITEPLGEVGATFEALEGDDRLPIRVGGTRPLRPIRHHDARSSAQVRTALLLAGLTGGTTVEVTEPHRSRDHSERLLGAMGAALSLGSDDGGIHVALAATDRLAPLTFRVPGDFSSAAFFLALGALRGDIRVPDVGINPTRTGMIDVLRRMGAEVEVDPGTSEAGEPVGDVVVRPGELQGTTVTPDEVPALIDEIPVLAVLAARAAGETRFEGVAELRVKESDRVSAVAGNLRALDVDVEDGPDTLVVRGTGGPLRGTADAHGDHRIAMAFAILAALPGNDVRVTGGEAVAISYPGFWDELERVNAEFLTQ